MALTDQYQRVPLGEIIVPESRQRHRESPRDGLTDSVKRNGVLNPIIVQHTGDGIRLVAGERRLSASKFNNLPDIPVRFVEDLSPVELQVLELEENVKRTDLFWKDRIYAVAKIHKLYQEMNIGWDQSKTAEALSMSRSTMSTYIRVYEGLEAGNKHAHNAKGIQEALNIIERSARRQMGNILNLLISGKDKTSERPKKEYEKDEKEGNKEKIEGFTHHETEKVTVGRTPTNTSSSRSSDSTILLRSFLDWAPTYEGEKFNLIHCDFPYGINAMKGESVRGNEPTGYEDTPENYFALVECLCKNLDRFMDGNFHIMFWYSVQNLKKTLSIFTEHAPHVRFHRHPLIWVKSDGSGVTQDPRRLPRHIYETALFGSQGRRVIVKTVADAISSPSERHLHPSTKPAIVLRHFFQMIVDEATSLLDPTCGSGSAIRAAESLGAHRTLGLEIDSGFCDSARDELNAARTLKRAN